MFTCTCTNMNETNEKEIDEDIVSIERYIQDKNAEITSSMRNGIPKGVDELILDYVGIENTRHIRRETMIDDGSIVITFDVEKGYTHNEYLKEILSTDLNWLFPSIKRPDIKQISNRKEIFENGYLSIYQRVLKSDLQKLQSKIYKSFDINTDHRFFIPASIYKLAYNAEHYDLIDWVEANHHKPIDICGDTAKLMVDRNDKKRLFQHIDLIPNMTIAMIKYIENTISDATIAIRTNNALEPVNWKFHNNSAYQDNKVWVTKINFLFELLDYIICKKKYKFEKHNLNFLYRYEQYSIVTKVLDSGSTDLINEHINNLIKRIYIQTSDDDKPDRKKYVYTYGWTTEKLILDVRHHAELNIKNPTTTSDHLKYIMENELFYKTYEVKSRVSQVVQSVRDEVKKNGKLGLQKNIFEKLYEYEATGDSSKLSAPQKLEFVRSKACWEIFRIAILFKNNEVMKHLPRILYRDRFVEVICANMNLDIVKLWFDRRPELFIDSDPDILKAAIAFNTLDVVKFLKSIMCVHYDRDCQLTAKFRLDQAKKNLVTHDKKELLKFFSYKTMKLEWHIAKSISDELRTSEIEFEDTDQIIYYNQLHIIKLFPKLIFSIDVNFLWDSEDPKLFNVNTMKSWFGKGVFDKQLYHRFIIDMKVPDGDKGVSLRFRHISVKRGSIGITKNLPDVLLMYQSSMYKHRINLINKFLDISVSAVIQ